MDQRYGDSDFATEVQTALDSDAWVPSTVTAKVKQGAVTLEGQVSWNFERDAAERTVNDLKAAGRVYNNIVVASNTTKTAPTRKVCATNSTCAQITRARR